MSTSLFEVKDSARREKMMEVVGQAILDMQAQGATLAEIASVLLAGGGAVAEGAHGPLQAGLLFAGHAARFESRVQAGLDALASRH